MSGTLGIPEKPRSITMLQLHYTSLERERSHDIQSRFVSDAVYKPCMFHSCFGLNPNNEALRDLVMGKLLVPLMLLVTLMLIALMGIIQLTSWTGNMAVMGCVIAQIQATPCKWVCSPECYQESEYLAIADSRGWFFSDITMFQDAHVAPPTIHMSGALMGGGPLKRGKNKQVHHCIVCKSTKHRLDTCPEPAAKLIRELQGKLQQFTGKRKPNKGRDVKGVKKDGKHVQNRGTQLFKPCALVSAT